MKTIVHVLVLLLCFTSTALAQKFEGIATYKTDRKVDIKMDGEGMDDAIQEQMAAMLRKQFQKEFTLTFTKNESIYEEVEGLDAAATKALNGLRIVVSAASDILYRNISENSFTNQTEIMGKQFLIEDSLQKPEWILEKETKNIGNYTCFKATRSREVKEQQLTSESDSLVEVTKLVTTIAWYTLDIPLQHGPSDYWGLPGLILQVEDGDLTILCSKIVLNPTEEITIEAPKKGKKVSEAAFEKIQKKKNEEMMERFKSDGRKKKDGNSFSIKIGGQ